MDLNFIRLLTVDDVVSYNSLLEKSFSSSRLFSSTASTRAWTSTDDYYPVLGLFNEGTLVSMMRVEWISSEKEFLIKADEKKMKRNMLFPLGYLAKAATDPEYEGRGYNSLLRYHAFQIFLNWKVHGVIGFMAEGSPRVNLLKKIGYNIYTKEEKWNGNFKSDKNVLVAELNSIEKVVSASEKLRTLVGEDLINKYKVNYLLKDLLMKGRVPFRFPWDL